MKMGIKEIICNYANKKACVVNGRNVEEDLPSSDVKKTNRLPLVRRAHCFSITSDNLKIISQYTENKR